MQFSSFVRIEMESQQSSLPLWFNSHNLKHRTITVECVETSILPFEHVSKERFRQSGSTSSHVRAFQEAYKEASAEQLKDDDGLPSMDDVFSQLSTLPPTSNSPSLKDTVCQKTYA